MNRLNGNWIIPRNNPIPVNEHPFDLDFSNDFRDAESRNVSKNGEVHHTEGLPQGAGTSPFLSILYLEHVMSDLQKKFPSLRYLAYADDLIIYTDDDEEFERILVYLGIEKYENRDYMVDYSASQIVNQGAGFSGARTSNVRDLPNSGNNKPDYGSLLLQGLPLASNTSLKSSYGIQLSTKKCQVTKQNGEWEMPWIKFLGLKYLHEERQLVSETRKGRKLTYSFEELTLVARFIENQPDKSQYPLMLDTLVSSLKDKVDLNIRYLLQMVSNKNLPAKRLRRYLSVTANMLERLEHSHQINFNDQLKAYWFQYISRKTSKLIDEIVQLPPISKVHDDLLYFTTIYSGLLLSRLYNGSKVIGSYKTPSGSQNFKLTYVTGSPCHIMHSKNPDLVNIHNASSYNLNNVLNYLGKKPFKPIESEKVSS